MAISQGMELLVNINALYKGNENFSRASQALGKLQDATKKFQDTAGKVQGFQKASDSLSRLQAQHGKIKSEYAATSEKINQAKTRSAELKAQYDIERAALQSKNAAMTQSQTEYIKQSELVSRLSEQIRNEPDGSNRKALTAQLEIERTKLKALDKVQKDTTKDYHAQEKAVKNASREYRQSQSEIKRLEDSEQKLSERVKSTSEALINQQNNFRKVESEINQAGINVEKFISQQDKMTAAMERSKVASDNLKAIKENLSWDSVKNKVALPAMATYATIQPMIKLAGDFESAMARVKAVSFAGDDADLSQFEALKAQAAQLGADTQFTAVQAANAMENLARAGMSYEAIRDTMTPLLNMSAAEGMGIDQAAGILAGVQSGMGMLASESERIADVLAYTSSASKTSIATLGEAFKTVGPTAKSLGISIEEISSYLGVLGNKMYEGSEAGTALSSSFLRLAKRPKDTRDELNKLGVAVVTRTGQMRKLPDILKAIEESFAKMKMGDAERLASLGRIFGTNYAPQMNALLSGVKDQGKILTGIRENAQGRAQRMANINLDTLNGQLTILSSAWDGFRTQIGDIFAPIMRSGVEALSTALSKISATMKEFPNLSKYVVMSLGAIASYRVISGVSSIAKSFIALPGAFLEVVNAGRNVSSVLASVGASAGNTGGIIATITGGISKSFAALISPITGAFNLIKIAALSSLNLICAHPIIAGGVALVAGVIMLAKNWDAVKEKLSRVCDYCREKWQALSDWWGSWSFPDIWAGLKNSFVETLGQLKVMWKDICNWFASLNPFKGIGEGISKVVSSAGSEQQVRNAINAVDNWGPPALHATGGIFSRPHMGIVAEDGPEAIIPLQNKSRGIPLLMSAARSLGVTCENNARDNILGDISKGESVNVLRHTIFSRGGNDGGDVRAFNNLDVSPVINITVNGGENNNDLAGRIASAVREAWDEIQSRQERLSFA